LKGFDYLFKNHQDILKKIIPEVKVFARVSPKQKEYVVTILKSLGYVTLMCGDGTNDVGALKHAHAGVALLSNTSVNNEKSAEYEQMKRAKINEAQVLSNEVQIIQRQSSNQQAMTNAQKKLNEVLKELEEAEQAHIVKLGDASIASPFTYKQSSIQCGSFNLFYLSLKNYMSNFYLISFKFVT
jgi:cation-transporting ATPase 13A1